MEPFGQIFWFFVILASLQPIMKNKMLESARYRLIRKLEKSNENRLITLIHRQETMRFLGFPVINYIDISESEKVI